MKTWIFIASFFSCSLLFFISGSLVGYSICEKSIVKKELESVHKEPRKPSIIEGVISPLVGRLTNRQIEVSKTRTRTPSTPAIQQANRYRELLHD